MEAQPSIDEVLGTPDLLASAARKEFAGRTFAGRHPILAFVLWPIPAALLMLIATTLIVAYPSEWLVELFKVKSLTRSGIHSSTTFEWIIAYSDVYILRFIPFVLTSWFFIRLSRHTKSPIWGLAACVCLAYFAFLFRVIVAPPTEQRDLCLRIGLCFEHGLHQWQNGLVQMAIPIVMGLWAWRKKKNWFNHGKAPLLFTLFATFLLSVICSAPLPTHFLKLANAAVFGLLLLSAIIGSGVCVAADRLRTGLR